MFIKLQYTANKAIYDCFRTVNAIINDPTITSASILGSKMATWATDFKASYDATNSTVIRTNDLSTTKSHYYKTSGTAGSRPNYGWTLEFSVPDSPTRKLYMQYRSTLNSTTDYAFLNVGDQITGGTMNSTQISHTQQNTVSQAYGTALTIAGNADNAQNGNTIIANNTAGGFVRTFWAYITDKAFVWCATLNQNTNSGFGTTYNTNTTFMGPYINSMYTRYDYWNKDSNGIIPWYYINTRGVSVGYGTSADFAGVFNVLYNSNQVTADSKVFNLVDAIPKLSTSFPTKYHSQVNQRVGHRSNYYAGHNSTVLGPGSTAATACYGKTITTTANERYPSADLSATTFINHPIGWDSWVDGCHGGNVSEESGIYMFNGDYQPGDTFSVGGKVYMIWPMYGLGYISRIGLSVPME
jgi:hypothetical protein